MDLIKNRKRMRTSKSFYDFPGFTFSDFQKKQVLDGVIIYWFSNFKDEKERNTTSNSVSLYVGWQKMKTDGRVKELLIFSFQKVNEIIRMNGSRK